MILLNKYGREVQVNSAVLEIINREKRMHEFKQLPCRTDGTGNPKHICLLIGNNGIGDDIHAMPAIKKKIDEGYTIDVFGRPFTRLCYESLGCNFLPYQSPNIGFVPKNLSKYGAIYHLSQWCMKHEQDTEGLPTKTRFQQFAEYLDVELPDSFDWVQHLIHSQSSTYVKGVGKTDLYHDVVTALHATSIHRSYQNAQRLYMQMKRKRINFVAYGDSPNERKVKSFEQMVGDIYSARVVVAVDTGPLAIALALRVPVVAVFGGSHAGIIVNQFDRYNNVAGYNAYSVLTEPNSGCTFPCSWHHKRGFQVNGKCREYADCMEIEPKRIIEEISKYL